MNDDPVETRVDGWMKQFAAIDDREHVLPDPAVIWLKARVLQAAKDAERASRPITTMQIAAYITVAACWAALLTWKWGAIQAWLDSMRPSHIVLGAAGAQTSSLSLSLLAVVVILGSATVMLAMHTIFAED